jgi:uncharacterized protein YjhX (UPF0386 family)
VLQRKQTSRELNKDINFNVIRALKKKRQSHLMIGGGSYRDCELGMASLREITNNKSPKQPL